MGEAAVYFVGGEVAEAERGRVGGIALVDLLQGEIFGLDNIFAGFHGFAVIGIEDHYGAVFSDAQAELSGGGFVVGEGETVADASTVNGMIDERGAPIAGSRDAFQYARAKGQIVGQLFGVSFEAGDEGGVLVEENEKEHGASSESGEMPFLRGERAEETQRVDGGDESEARDEQADPARALIGIEIFREKRCDAKGYDTEFEKKKAVFPPIGGAWRAAKVQSGHEQAKGKDNGGDVAIAFTEDEELVGAVEEVKRMIGPSDFIGGMMGEEQADGEDEEETEDRKGEAPAREVLPEEQVGRSAEKPHGAERVPEEHERDERKGDELEFGAGAPDEREAKAGQCDGQIVVHETHVEDVAVGKHGEERREVPGGAARGNDNEGEDAPEEEQDAKSHGHFLGRGDAE